MAYAQIVFTMQALFLTHAKKELEYEAREGAEKKEWREGLKSEKGRSSGRG